MRLEFKFQDEPPIVPQPPTTILVKLPLCKDFTTPPVHEMFADIDVTPTNYTLVIPRRVKITLETSRQIISFTVTAGDALALAKALTQVVDSQLEQKVTLWAQP